MGYGNQKISVAVYSSFEPAHSIAMIQMLQHCLPGFVQYVAPDKLPNQDEAFNYDIIVSNFHLDLSFDVPVVNISAFPNKNEIHNLQEVIYDTFYEKYDSKRMTLHELLENFK